MPYRNIIFRNGSVYHIFNKTIDHKTIFESPHYCDIFLNIIRYYISSKAQMSYSHVRILKKNQQDAIMKAVSFKKYFKTQILAYCLMPNHFHLLLKQKVDFGVQTFIKNTINSFTRYFNIQNNRVGPLFLPRFKAKLMNTDEQLMHVSRYIHLNPYSSGLIKDTHKIIDYPYSTFRHYVLSSKDKLVENEFVLRLFNSKRDRYEKFVLQNAEYQKTLEYCKYATKFLKR